MLSQAMTVARSTPSPGRRRRADADRSEAAILDAAVEALAVDPEVTMAEIARRAGVVRATIYVHFPTRDALIAAVTDRAIAQASEALQAAAAHAGEPDEALVRMLTASWRTLGRYHALVAINSRLAPDELRDLHEPILRLLRPLLERGQERGAFNPALPVEWMLTVVLELIHAASRAISSGSLSEATAKDALIASTLGALRPHPDDSVRRRGAAQSASFKPS
jgi:AcrR family transcriptional regulator